EEPPVRAESHGGHPLPMMAEALLLFSGFQVPDANRAVRAAGREKGFAGAEGEGRDGAAVARQELQESRLPGRVERPEPDRLIVAGGRQEVSIGTEGQGMHGETDARTLRLVDGGD